MMMANRQDFLNALFKSYFAEHKGHIEIRIMKRDDKNLTRGFYGIDEIAKKDFKDNDTYFGVCPRATNKDGTKKNIQYITALWADIDYGEKGHRKKSKFDTLEQAMSSIKALRQQPSIIVSSGGGFQPYWLLREPLKIENVNEVEGIMKGMSEVLGGDNVQNIDRILRLPETFNCKTKDKRKVEIIHFDENARFNLNDFDEYYIEKKNYTSHLLHGDDDDSKEATKENVDALKKLSGAKELKGEIISFKKNTDGTTQTLVNGQSTSAWIDKNGYIGSHDDGGPTWVQWVMWYGYTFNEALEIGCKYGITAPTPKLNIYRDRKNKYYKIKNRTGKKDIESYERVNLSNFTMDILRVHQQADNALMQIRFKRYDGKNFGEYSITTKDMATSKDFKAYCFNKGRKLFWDGDDKDLTNLWKLELSKIDDKITRDIARVGYIEEHDLWIFGNVAIDKDGNELPFKDGSFLIDKDNGIRPIPLTQDAIITLNKEKYDTTEAEIKLGKGIGALNIKLALGWIAAQPFSGKIIPNEGGFPFLFASGATRAGKTTTGELVMNFAAQKSKAFQIGQSTAVGMERTLSYYSHCPVFYDEYSLEKKIADKENFLRSIYNRTPRQKGTREGQNVIQPPIRGTLFLAGETTPDDSALLSRAVRLFVANAKHSPEDLIWFNENRSKFSYFFYDLLRRRKQLEPAFIKKYQKIKNDFVSKDIESRTALHYAIVSAGYIIARGLDQSDEDSFLDDVLREAIKSMRENTDELVTNIFLDDILAMQANGKFKHNLWAVGTDEIKIYFSGLYAEWEKETRAKGKENRFSGATIKSYLQSHESFICGDRQVKINGSNLRCMVFNKEKCFEQLRTLVGADAGDYHDDHKKIGTEGYKDMFANRANS
jgi:hypothetical protein